MAMAIDLSSTQAPSAPPLPTTRAAMASMSMRRSAL
jgi:hypothetical protein